MIRPDTTDSLKNRQRPVSRIKHIFRRYFMFLIVAGLATLIHISILWIVVEFLSVSPLPGNVLAFTAAFVFNYWGQRSLTFSIHQRFSADLIFGLLLNFLLNQSIYSVLLWLSGWHYLACLVLTLAAVSPLSFLIVYTRTQKLKSHESALL